MVVTEDDLTSPTTLLAKAVSPRYHLILQKTESLNAHDTRVVLTIVEGRGNLHQHAVAIQGDSVGKMTAQVRSPC